MKVVKKFVKRLFIPNTKKAFYLLVECSECREQVKVRINQSSDFQVEYDPKNEEHYYTIKKEVIGKNCFNLMKAKLALTRKLKVLFADCGKCRFINFDRE